MTRVANQSQIPEAKFERFPRSYGHMVWLLEHFFCKKVDDFPGSMVVSEKSTYW